MVPTEGSVSGGGPEGNVADQADTPVAQPEEPGRADGGNDGDQRHRGPGGQSGGVATMSPSEATPTTTVRP